MDYLFDNAREIMYLCFGAGFLIFFLCATRMVIIATRLLKKIDDLTDLFIHYIQKPLMFLMEIQKFLSKILGWWKK